MQMYGPNMPLHVAHPRESRLAKLAMKWLVAGMDKHVHFKILSPVPAIELFVTSGAVQGRFN